MTDETDVDKDGGPPPKRIRAEETCFTTPCTAGSAVAPAAVIAKPAHEGARSSATTASNSSIQISGSALPVVTTPNPEACAALVPVLATPQVAKDEAVCATENGVEAGPESDAARLEATTAWLKDQGVELADFLNIGYAPHAGQHVRIRDLADGAGEDGHQMDISPLFAKIPASAVLSDADIPCELRHGTFAWSPDFLPELQDNIAMKDVCAAAEFACRSGLPALRNLFVTVSRIGTPKGGKNYKAKKKQKYHNDPTFAGVQGQSLDPEVVKRLRRAPAECDFYTSRELAGNTEFSSETALVFWKKAHSWTGVESILLFICLVRKGHLREHPVGAHFAGYINSLPGFPAENNGNRAPDCPICWTDREIRDFFGGSDMGVEVKKIKAHLRGQAAYVVGPRFGISEAEWLWARAAYTSRCFGSFCLPTDSGALKMGATVPVLLPCIDAFNHRLDFPVQVKKITDDQSVALVLDASAADECFADGIYPGMEVFNCYGQKSDHELLLNYGFCEAICGDGDVGNPYNSAALRFPGLPAESYFLRADFGHLQARPRLSQRIKAVLLEYRAAEGLRFCSSDGGKERQESDEHEKNDNEDLKPIIDENKEFEEIFRDQSKVCQDKTNEDKDGKPLEGYEAQYKEKHDCKEAGVEAKVNGKASLNENRWLTVHVNIPAASDYLAFLENSGGFSSSSVSTAPCGETNMVSLQSTADPCLRRILDLLKDSEHGSLAADIRRQLADGSAALRVNLGGLIPEQLLSDLMQLADVGAVPPCEPDFVKDQLASALANLRDLLEKMKVSLLLQPSAMTCSPSSDFPDEAVSSGTSPCSVDYSKYSSNLNDVREFPSSFRRRHAKASRYLRGLMQLYVRTLTWLEEQDF